MANSCVAAVKTAPHSDNINSVHLIGALTNITDFSSNNDFGLVLTYITCQRRDRTLDIIPIYVSKDKLRAIGGCRFLRVEILGHINLLGSGDNASPYIEVSSIRPTTVLDEDYNQIELFGQLTQPVTIRLSPNCTYDLLIHISLDCACARDYRVSIPCHASGAMAQKIAQRRIGSNVHLLCRYDGTSNHVSVIGCN